MLASKPAFSASLGMQASQTPTPNFNMGPSQKSATAPKSQDGGLFASPTESEFSAKDGLEVVR